MGNIKEAGIWGVKDNAPQPGVVVGTIRCHGSTDLRQDHATASDRVDIVTNNQKVKFDGKLWVGNELWYRVADSGAWLFAMYVVMNDSTLPWLD